MTHLATNTMCDKKKLLIPYVVVALDRTPNKSTIHKINVFTTLLCTVC